MSTAPNESLPRSFVFSAKLPVASPGGRLLRLFFEGLFFTACALIFARAIGVPQGGFFAVFLAAAGPTSRVDEFLAENRRAIQVMQMAAWRANTWMAVSVLGLFLGSLLAFVVAALWLGEGAMRSEFGFVLDVAQLGHDTIVTRRFAGALPLFVNNALVLLAFFGLSFVYRSYGALLTLSWNACVWGLVLAFLVRRGMASSSVPPAAFVVVSVLALLPHLLLEAAAYVVAAIAAIFLSKAFVKYTPSDPIFLSVVRSSLALLAVALLALLIGAVVEATLPRLVLPLLAN